jgi:GWxTD domain-containing protein
VFVRARAILLLALLAAGAGAATRAGAAPPSRDEQVELLHRRALAYGARNTLDTRRMALRCLERATLLAPERADLQLELGRLYDRMGFLRQARKRFEKVAALQPTDAQAHVGLARLWRRDYLKYLDPASLERAIDQLRLAARLDSNDAEIQLNLASLLLQGNDLAGAGEAVARARASAPDRNDVRLADGLVAYRLGRLEHADSAFAAAVPRLTHTVRERFEDIAPLASARDTFTLHRLGPEDRAEFVRRFWADLDPDLSTSINEARLAYYGRVAEAYFLYFDTRRREWDLRGEVYVRYGAPASATYNPVGAANVIQMGNYGIFPMNTLVWNYPELGMSVVLQDRLLSEYYLLPLTTDHDPDPVPDPEVLAQHPEAFATRSGRGVFPVLPPGVTPVPVQGVVARFQGADSPRLLALLATPGAPSDSSRASLAVLDSTRREVARLTSPLSPSACDPAARRVADFASELPPGEYLVGLTVEDGRGGRGIVRSTVRLAPVQPVLAMSDVVVACGRADVVPGGRDAPPAVRLNANPAAEVAPGSPLTAYFEVYHLRTGSDGMAKLEFEYTVHSAARDRRVWIQRLFAPRPGIPDISARREDVQAGDLRRQFVEVPVQSLPPGPYRLEIVVRDLIGGEQVTASVPFTRL